KEHNAVKRAVIAGLLLIVGTASFFVLTLGRPWPAPAQQAPPQQPAQQAPAQETPAAASVPEGYVGAETCKGCHDEAFHKFQPTRMGRLFLKQPRNMTESLACENCHGPGQKHVEAGGGKGVGGKVSFGKKYPAAGRKA